MLLPGQGVSGGRSPILIRSEPEEPIELDDSDSLPIPVSLPKPLREGGRLVGSAGRATGRVDGPLGGTEGFGAEGALALLPTRGAGVGRLAAAAFGLDELPRVDPDRLAADRFPSSFPARVEVDERLVVLRFGPADLALGLVAARFASVFPARFAVMRLADEVGFFAVERFAADFLVEDFFFAGISPPSDGESDSPGGLSADTPDPLVFLRVIASAFRKDKQFQ